MAVAPRHWLAIDNLPVGYGLAVRLVKTVQRRERHRVILDAHVRRADLPAAAARVVCDIDLVEAVGNVLSSRLADFKSNEYKKLIGGSHEMGLANVELMVPFMRTLGQAEEVINLLAKTA